MQEPARLLVLLGPRARGGLNTAHPALQVRLQTRYLLICLLREGAGRAVEELQVRIGAHFPASLD